MRISSDTMLKVRENHGHHLKRTYESKSSCSLARGGVKLSSAWPALFSSYSLISSVRRLEDVRQIKSSSISLFQAVAQGVMMYVFFPVFFFLMFCCQGLLQNEISGPNRCVVKSL